MVSRLQMQIAWIQKISRRRTLEPIPIGLLGTACTWLLSLSAALAIASPTTSHAASNFTIRGAGHGNGVGMSQWGALGMAKQGFNYTQILAHYYSGIALGKTDPAQIIRVLLQPSVGTVSFLHMIVAVPNTIARVPSVAIKIDALVFIGSTIKIIPLNPLY